MATTHGRVGEFDPNLEDWTSYTERLQQYFTANDVAEDKQRAVLLSGCGVATYCLIKEPDSPGQAYGQIFHLASQTGYRSP